VDQPTSYAGWHI